THLRPGAGTSTLGSFRGHCLPSAVVITHFGTAFANSRRSRSRTFVPATFRTRNDLNRTSTLIAAPVTAVFERSNVRRLVGRRFRPSSVVPVSRRDNSRN